MHADESGMLLIVPEQYSHDAERQLCAVCGDRLSLYAETVSFTRLCNNVLSEVGKATTGFIDSSGQILVLYRALESVAPNLRVFGVKKLRTELLEKLLDAIKEFKSLNISAQTLESISKQTSNPLSDKLYDLALIYDAYDAVLHLYGNDAADRLSLLADHIGESTVGNTGHIYFDGFNDFTAQELSVIEELLRKKAVITVCLTFDPDDNGEIFEIPRRTLNQLCRLADDVGVKVNREFKTAVFKNVSELAFLEKYLFNDAPPEYDRGSDTDECESVVVYAAPSRYAECEYAAYETLKLIHKGYRWRDIGVMARDWGEYGSICENVFDKYGIPYFTGEKVDILSKPPLTLIDAALEIAIYGWEYKTIFKFIKTGLAGLSVDECAIFENYVLKWKIRGNLWQKNWIMPPHGYGRVKDTDDEVLKQINKLRLRIVEPLEKLHTGLKGDSSAEEKLKCLYRFLDDISLPESLDKKVDDFTDLDELRFADEYKQLWEIIVSATEQMHLIINDEILNTAEFRKLVTLALSQYDVGVIPISLDRTGLGGMAMSRRRDLKCLIILGASDDRLPTVSKNSGALSDNERAVLTNLGTEIHAGLEERLYREMNMLYSVVTLPSEKLVVIHSTGAGQRPSFISKRLCLMYGISEKVLPEDVYMAIAEKPYIELLKTKKIIYDSEKQEYYEDDSDTLVNRRENISEQAARLLYGERISLSPSRADRYYSCPYKHFLHHGLRLEPRSVAEFDSLSAGNFIHFVLDGVFSDVKSGDGFKNTNSDIYMKLTEEYINKYINDVLLNFEGKNERFKYLFMRYKADVFDVVNDMLDELAKSEFEPYDLEFDISSFSKTERGIIDRVDGFKHDDKLYLRVIDYKTHRRAYSFDISDILFGRDMQMLIYLFALEKYGSVHYGVKPVPAGVLYIPARDVIISASRNSSEGEIAKLRKEEMRRSGLMIDDPQVLEAMEKGVVKDYLPVKSGGTGGYVGNGLVNAKQLTILSSHVNALMDKAREEIKNGVIECTPYYKNEQINACNYCDYHTVCRFDEESGDSKRFAGKMKSDDVWNILEYQYEEN